MKILLTGGGTGGHFYPLIALAEGIKKITREKKLLDVKLFYMAPTPYDEGALFDNQITFIRVPAGKIRRYFSILNLVDIFKTFFGVLSALWKVFKIYPDVVVGKGGYVSFPTLFAARILRIPVVIHESDSVPGRTNIWAGKFAERIAVSYKEAMAFFPTEKTAWTGNPIRNELTLPQREGAHEFLKLEVETPTILILGGSLGSQMINDTLIDALPELVKKYQILHQTGRTNIESAKNTAAILLKESSYKARYHAFDYLNTLAIRMCAGASQLVISRAGSTIFEIAAWKIPAILIPITESNGDHQRKNAYAYARSGAAIVIEEGNLNSSILVQEINRLMENPAVLENMKKSAETFARLDSASVIASEILRIAESHEK